jgi:hypothetical protein
MSEEGSNVNVHFRFMQSWWRSENRKVTESELKKLLEGATLVNLEFQGWSSTKSLQGVTLRLKDGRKCELIEENNPSWEGSSEGWINISIDEDWSE